MLHSVHVCVFACAIKDDIIEVSSAERWLSWSKALDWKSSGRAKPRLVGSNPTLSAILFSEAPIAQLDRATDFGSVGWGFNSLWARQFKTQILAVLDGEVAVPCNPQSAIAGSKSCPRVSLVGLPGISGEDVWVLRSRNPQTPSGPEGSSGKWTLLGAVGVPESS